MLFPMLILFLFAIFNTTLQTNNQQLQKIAAVYKNHHDNVSSDIALDAAGAQKAEETSTDNTSEKRTPLQILSKELIREPSLLQARKGSSLGAFVHLSKTGGSTLSLLLRNGCHSFVPKPCFGIERNSHPINPLNETAASKLTTYYHVPDFENGLLFSTQHEFYVFTLRDPLNRTISAYLCSHPENALEVFSFQANNKVFREACRIRIRCKSL